MERGFRRLKNTIIIAEWVPDQDKLAEGPDAPTVHLSELTSEKEADLQVLPRAAPDAWGRL